MSLIRHLPRAPTAAAFHGAGEGIVRHRHDDHQVIHVSSGVVALHTPDEAWVTGSDHAVWLPAGTWHEHRFYGDCVLRTVGFPSSSAPVPDQRPAVLVASPLLRQLLIAVTDPHLSAPEQRRLRGVITDQLRRADRSPLTLPAPSDPRLAAACQQVLDELDRPMTLPSLARAVGSTERTLARLFRDELAMTYPQWRTRARTLTATVLLAEGHSVTDTATTCGWATTSSFIEAFRRVTGSTPGTHRASS